MDADRTDDAELTIEEPGKKTRRKWTAAEKRQIARQALRRGAVLQQVAQRHGIHPSLLYTWRRQYRAGSAAIRRTAPSRTMLLPVKVRRSTAPQGQQPAPVSSSTETMRQPGAIEVEFRGDRRLCVRGVVDVGTLRTVMQELSQP
jgi:transposase